MNITCFVAAATGFALSIIANPVQTRQSESYQIGNPLGLPFSMSGEAEFEPISSHMKVMALFSLQKAVFMMLNETWLWCHTAVCRKMYTNMMHGRPSSILMDQ